MIFLTGPQTSGSHLDVAVPPDTLLHHLHLDLWRRALWWCSFRAICGGAQERFLQWDLDGFHLSHALFFLGGLLCLHICIHIVYINTHTHTELQYIPQLYIILYIIYIYNGVLFLFCFANLYGMMHQHVLDGSSQLYHMFYAVVSNDVESTSLLHTT